MDPISLAHLSRGVSPIKTAAKVGVEVGTPTKKVIQVASAIIKKVQPERFGHVLSGLKKVVASVIFVETIKYGGKLFGSYLSCFSKENFDVEAYKASVRQCLLNQNNRVIGLNANPTEANGVDQNPEAILDQRLDAIFDKALQENKFFKRSLRKAFVANILTEFSIEDKTIANSIAKSIVISKKKVVTPLSQKIAAVSLFFTSITSTIVTIIPVSALAKISKFCGKVPIFKPFLKLLTKAGEKFLSIGFMVGYAAQAYHSHQQMNKIKQEMLELGDDGDNVKRKELEEEISKLKNERNVALLDCFSAFLNVVSLVLYAVPGAGQGILILDIIAYSAKGMGAILMFKPIVHKFDLFVRGKT